MNEDDRCPKWNRLLGSMVKCVCRERSGVKLKRIEQNQSYRQMETARTFSDREPCLSSIL